MGQRLSERGRMLGIFRIVIPNRFAVLDVWLMADITPPERCLPPHTSICVVLDIAPSLASDLIRGHSQWGAIKPGQ